MLQVKQAVLTSAALLAFSMGCGRSDSPIRPDSAAAGPVDAVLGGEKSSPAQSTAVESTKTRPKSSRFVDTTPPKLSHEEVMYRFHARASVDERRLFEKLAASQDSDSRDRAMEMVMFKLNEQELLEIGITATDGGNWAVVWSHDYDANAIVQALNEAGGPSLGSCGHGFVGWYVRRSQFFAARKALLESAELRTCDIGIVTPKFSLR